MKKTPEPIFYIDNESLVIECQMNISNKVYKGFAACCPEDMEFFSELTGQQIAVSRAYINYLKDLKKEILIELKTMRQFYSNIKMSPNFEENNYVVKSLSRTIKKLQLELSTIQSDIKSEKRSLNFYITEKDKIYRKIELKRKAEATCEN